jgi:ribosome-associated protein
MRTALELRLDVRASSLPDAVKQPLVTLAGRKLTADGILLIDDREHRTQAQNREAAAFAFSADRLKPMRPKDASDLSKGLLALIG